ncbi:MAG: Hsp20/alpha crystallin family protein [Opitutaceae bacterium]|jgi:HSP20 family protein|nr:Hsp20/alpha crystallin family protein [Opitutaceae bacterium]
MRYIRYNYPTRRSLPVAAFGRGAWNGLESEIDRLFDAALSGTANATTGGRFPVDVYQDTNNVFVRAELPGFDRKAINVEVVDGYLTIEASREGDDEKAMRATKFNRSVCLPEDVTTDGVTAAYVAGILTVTLPKKEEAKPRKIAVAVK